MSSFSYQLLFYFIHFNLVFSVLIVIIPTSITFHIMYYYGIYSFASVLTFILLIIKIKKVMSKDSNSQQTTVVYVVTCYQNIVGVYASQDDAALCQKDLILKNRPADILCRSIIYPQSL